MQSLIKVAVVIAIFMAALALIVPELKEVTEKLFNFSAILGGK